MAMTLTSPAFESGKPIPVKYSCKGDDVSPELKWENAPDGTKSFALIVDDPDAPGQTWDHWLLYHIPAKTHALAEDADGNLPPGIAAGKNSWGRNDYGGPCPPSGTHRYFFRIFALDAELELPSGATKKELQKAMEGHVLDQAELMGTFSK